MASVVSVNVGRPAGRPQLALRFENPQMVKQFAQAGRPGAYPRILREGDVGAGDPVEVLDRPGHGITIAFVARAIFGDRELRTRALTAPRLAGSAVALLRERAALRFRRRRARPVRRRRARRPSGRARSAGAGRSSRGCG